MTEEEVAAVRSEIASLMVSDNQGDIHEVIIRLCRLAGIPEPEGNFLDGWTEDDFAAVGLGDRNP